MLRLNDQEDGTAGSAEAFEIFFAATNPRLFTALWLVTGDRYEAEEIAQDAFLQVLERWDRVGLLDNPESYLFRTAMNVFRNRYRRAALAVVGASRWRRTHPTSSRPWRIGTRSSGCSVRSHRGSGQRSWPPPSWTCQPKRPVASLGCGRRRFGRSRRAPARA